MMEKTPTRIHNPNNFLYVYWIITDFCNQKCSYCPPRLHSGEYYNNPNFTTSDVINFAHKLVDISIKTNKKIFLDLAGGEPTIYEPLADIMSILKPHSFIGILTNGTRGISWWKELPVLPDKVVVSLHPEYYDKQKIRINELTEFLIDNNVVVQFNLMCLHNKWDIVMSIIQDIDEKYRSLIIPKVIQNLTLNDRPVDPYTSEQLEFIKTYPANYKKIPGTKPIHIIYSNESAEIVKPNPLIACDEHYFEGWRCSAGIEGISIKPNGNVMAGICNARLLGTIKQFELLKDYLICPRVSCVCPGDIILSKYKPIFGV